MAFKAGAVIGEAFLNDQQWMTAASRMQGANKSLVKGIQILSAAVSTALVASLAASVKVADEFRKEFSNVRTLVDESQVDMQAMQKSLLGLDARLGSSIDLTKGLYQALSASVEPTKAVMFVGEAAKFAKASLIDTNTAVDVITTSLNAYGLEAEKTTKISDILFSTIKLGKTTGQELAATIGDVIPSAATLGVSMEELGASIATMTRQGINSATSTTQLNALMTAFIKPSTAMQEQLEKMGIASGSALIEAEGLSGALEFLMETTGGNKEALAQMLPNVRALKGAFALTGEQSEVYSSILEQMKTAAGATDEAFQKQELTFATLGNQLQKTGIIVGQRLLPAVYNITTAFTDLLSDGRALDAVMGALEVSFGVIGDVVKTITETGKGVFSELKNEFSSLGQELSLNIDFFDILNGVVFFVQTAIKLLGKNISNLVKRFFRFVEIGSSVVKIVQLVGKVFQEKLEPIINSIKKVVEPVADGIKNTFGKIKETITSALKKSGKAVDDYIDKQKELGGTGSKIFTELESILKKAGEQTKATFGGDMTDQINLVMEEYKKFIGGTEKNAGRYKDLWESSINKSLSDPAKKETEDGKKVISEFVDDTDKKTLTLAEKIKSNLEKVGKAITGFFKGTGGKILSNIEFVANHAANLYNTISGVATQSLENQLNELKANNEKMLAELESNKAAQLEQKDQEFVEKQELLQEQLDQGIITQQEFDAKTKELETQRNAEKKALEQDLNDSIASAREEARRKENEQQKKIFEANKGNQIANIWIQAALGIMSAWSQSIAQLGPIAGSVFAGVLTAAMLGVAAAQTAVIAQQKFVPAFQSGGMAGGTVRVNEAGGEIITLPDGSQVIPNDISRQIAADAGSNQTITINMNNPSISNQMDLNMITNHIERQLGRRLRETR